MFINKKIFPSEKIKNFFKLHFLKKKSRFFRYPDMRVGSFKKFLDFLFKNI